MSLPASLRSALDGMPRIHWTISSEYASYKSKPKIEEEDIGLVNHLWPEKPLHNQILVAKIYR
jgi:hypothetical protein